jgi:hypothetical protein
MRDERKPVWPWIVAVLIGLPVLYVGLLGPAFWLADLGLPSPEPYRPLARLAAKHPGILRESFFAYTDVFSTKGRSSPSAALMVQEELNKWEQEQFPQ